MPLRNGRKIHVYIWTTFPKKEKVITRVELLGNEDKQLLMEKGEILNGVQGTSSLMIRRTKKIFTT